MAEHCRSEEYFQGKIHVNKKNRHRAIMRFGATKVVRKRKKNEKEKDIFTRLVLTDPC